MSWNAELRPDGMFTITNQAGHPLFDGAFRSDIPESVRIKLLHVIAEAPAMLTAIGQTQAALQQVLKALVEKVGGLETGQQQAPWLFQLVEMLQERIDSAAN